MSMLQEQAIQMIHGLSDDNIHFLIEIIRRLMSQKAHADIADPSNDDKRVKAFERLDAARTEIRRYLPEGTDPDKELEEARAERYGDIDRCGYDH